MKDRELLEKAAKALGMPLTDNGVRNLGLWEWLYCGDKEWGLYANNANGTQRRWNPLLSDGDALRLAVRLGLNFYEGDDDGRAAYVGYYEQTGNTRRQRFAVERHDAHQDAFAATRLAIVRAAAECLTTPNAEFSGPPPGAAKSADL